MDSTRSGTGCNDSVATKGILPVATSDVYAAGRVNVMRAPNDSVVTACATLNSHLTSLAMANGYIMRANVVTE